MNRISCLSRVLARHYTTDPLRSASVSSSEIAKFARASAEWWNPNGQFKYLHAMNRTRTSYIRARLDDLARNTQTIVDVGCGGGLASESLARIGFNVLGIDAASENIGIARAHACKDRALTRLEYRQATAEQLVDNGEEFDAVVSLEVIEHVTDPNEFVKSLVGLAKPGGTIVVSTMNRTALAWLIDVVVPEYLLGVVPRGTHNVDKFVEPERLREMFASAGAMTVDVSGLVLDPVRNVCHLVPRHFGLLRDVGVQANYIITARKN